MQVILLEKVVNLGSLGDTVKVKPGYARNFLIPQGKAVLANAANLAAFEARRAELERQQEESLQGARSRAEALEGVEITLARRAGEEGRLFGSVTSADVAEALTARGTEVSRQEVRISEPIRQLGDYAVQLHLHMDVDVEVQVHVVSES